MVNGFLFFDVETPNRFNNRICSIGTVRTDLRGNILDKQYFLVNPETSFDRKNIEIHGIDYSQVQSAECFSNLWDRSLHSLFSDCVVVAHNAQFDMCVLNKTLCAYEIPTFDTNYICTMDLAKTKVRGLNDYGLSTLCNHFSIPLLSHHNAMDDALACEQLFWNVYNPDIDGDYFGYPYLWKSAFNEPPIHTTSKAMVDLYGILVGASFRGGLGNLDLHALQEWAERHRGERSCPIFREIYGLIENPLRTGSISESEVLTLCDIAAPFIDTFNGNAKTHAMQVLIGILRGILSDGHVSKMELLNLKIWLEENGKDEFPEYSQLYGLAEQILADGEVNQDEEAHLMATFQKIVDPAIERCNEQETGTICGLKFVLSGDFETGSKKEIGEKIISAGGEVVGGVSKKVSYVVVGQLKSQSYAFGNYGTKVKKALELAEKGTPIKVITENDLLAMLNG